ncbi:pyruvate formate-lyase-activating protein [Anaerotalea alkaliphila]|uniref:Pyruvate formate-lyase-activating enzyme n=1 Tax=Anaerotalea alkaliphila TaxID=2662126 RepID=A0A7X5KN27_9FIRM|nr:pyruvate formate-lyase-activating protein [Anaerotalea alkaliphila]NDL66362.1 pyruvate formate lyase-activating protein [Anaerotalea alkaliphila]
MSATLKVHSLESCGTVDGPGIRFVVFLQGCALRCQYCHNPDTWKMSGGTAYTVEELFAEISKYKSYMRFSKGGVTVTGGDPLLQAGPLVELFKLCRESGIHTALDTSGFLLNDRVKELLGLTDLVLLDIKHFDPETYKAITGAGLGPTLEFFEYTQAQGIPVWIRYVLVPGLSDQPEHIRALAAYLGGFQHIQRIDVLPFHKMGEYKWNELGYEYKLGDTPEPSKESLVAAMAIFKEYNLQVATT